MNIYKRKKELYDNIYLFHVLFSILFFLGIIINIICMSSFYFIYLIGSTIIFGIISFIFQKMYTTVFDNMCDIEETLTKNFGEEEALEMIKTFNDEQFNKILEVSRAIDKNNKKIEQDYLNSKIKEIKDKYNI